MQREINDGKQRSMDIPEILATYGTQNKTEKKPTKNRGVPRHCRRVLNSCHLLVTRHETNIDKSCRTPLYEII